MRAINIRDARRVAVVVADNRVAVDVLLWALLCTMIITFWPGAAQAAPASGAVRGAVKSAVKSAVAAQDSAGTGTITIGTPGLITVSQEGSYTLPAGEVRKIDLYT
jgi:hypothetical protein